MYRVFCESYANYLKAYSNQESKKEYRYRIMEPIGLLTEPELYHQQKQKCSIVYKQLSDLLVYMNDSIDKYPKFKAFLWTIESRGYEARYFGVASEDDMKEQSKIINMFLNLIYWDDTEQKEIQYAESTLPY